MDFYRERKFERGTLIRFEFILKLLFSMIIAGIYFVLFYIEKTNAVNFITSSLKFANVTSRISIGTFISLNFEQ